MLANHRLHKCKLVGIENFVRVRFVTSRYLTLSYHVPSLPSQADYLNRSVNIQLIYMTVLKYYKYYKSIRRICLSICLR